MTQTGTYIPPTAQRLNLPDRREQITRTIEFEGQKIQISIGQNPQTLLCSEVFICGGGKTGSGGDRQLGDLGVLISHLLQRGATPKELADSVGRLGAYPNVDGQQQQEFSKVPPASWIGAILDVVEQEAAFMARPPDGDLYRRIAAAGECTACPGEEVEADGYVTFHPSIAELQSRFLKGF